MSVPSNSLNLSSIKSSSAIPNNLSYKGNLQFNISWFPPVRIQSHKRKEARRIMKQQRSNWSRQPRNNPIFLQIQKRSFLAAVKRRSRQALSDGKFPIKRRRTGKDSESAITWIENPCRRGTRRIQIGSWWARASQRRDRQPEKPPPLTQVEEEAPKAKGATFEGTLHLSRFKLRLHCDINVNNLFHFLTL